MAQSLPKQGSFLNVEFKARCTDLDRPRSVLEEMGAQLVGTDHQVDTYFRVPRGRLKLREGTVEQALIYYERPDQAGPKPSEVILHPAPGDTLKAVLTAALGLWVVVDKRREIYFLDNVKVHLDRVAALGTFVEVEAIDPDGTRDAKALQAQCEGLLARFDVQPGDLVSVSYSDLVAAPSSESEPETP